MASVLPSGEHEFWGNPCHFRKKSRGRWGGISGLFKSWSKVKWRGDQIKNANLSTFSPSLSLSSLLSPRVSPPSFPRPERAASRAILESGGGKKRKEIEAPGLFGSLAGRQFPGLKGSAVGCLRNWQPLGLQRGCFSVKEGGGGVSCGWLAQSGHWQFPNSVVPARARWALTHYTKRRKRPEALEAWCYKAPDRLLRKR